MVLIFLMVFLTLAPRFFNVQLPKLFYSLLRITYNLPLIYISVIYYVLLSFDYRHIYVI